MADGARHPGARAMNREASLPRGRVIARTPIGVVFITEEVLILAEEILTRYR
jgi:hypothetical protein